MSKSFFRTKAPSAVENQGIFGLGWCERLRTLGEYRKVMHGEIGIDRKLVMCGGDGTDRTNYLWLIYGARVILCVLGSLTY